MSIKKITHKLAHDALALTLITFGALVCADVIFPGFLTQFLSYTVLTFIIAVLLLIIVATEQDAKRTHAYNSTHSRILFTAITIGLLCITLTLRNFTLWEKFLIITLLAVLAMSLVRSDPTKNLAHADDRAQ